MCNACGFLCCAYDGFSKCGCDHCPNPACWDEEDDFRCDSDDDWEPPPTTAQREFVRGLIDGTRCGECGEKHSPDFDCTAETRALIAAVFPELDTPKAP